MSLLYNREVSKWNIFQGTFFILLGILYLTFTFLHYEEAEFKEIFLQTIVGGTSLIAGIRLLVKKRHKKPKGSEYITTLPLTF